MYIHIKSTFITFSEHYVDPEDEPVELLVVTVEEESLFQAAYPDVVSLYQVEKSEILQKKQKSKSRSLFLMHLCILPECKKAKNIFHTVEQYHAKNKMRS